MKLINLIEMKSISLMNDHLVKNSQEFHIALIDLDKFGGFNRKFGYEKGDEKLEAFCSSLNKLFKDFGFLSRLGSDEFIVGIPTDRFRLEDFKSLLITTKSNLSMTTSIAITKSSYPHLLSETVKKLKVLIQSAKIKNGNIIAIDI